MTFLAAALAVAGCLVVPLTGCGITAPVSSPGHADLESLGMRDTDRVVSLSIGPTLLRLAANHVDDDPEVGRLFAGLTGVRVRVYEIDGDAGRVARRIDRMSDHLAEDGWARVAMVSDSAEVVHMLVREIDGAIVGLTVLVSDGSAEAVVVNVMGTIEPAGFPDLMAALDIDHADLQNVRLAGG